MYVKNIEVLVWNVYVEAKHANRKLEYAKSCGDQDRVDFFTGYGDAVKDCERFKEVECEEDSMYCKGYMEAVDRIKTEVNKA